MPSRKIQQSKGMESTENAILEKEWTKKPSLK